MLKTFILAFFFLLACITFQPVPSPTPPPIPEVLETPTPISISLDQPFQLRVGQRGVLGTGELTVELQTILRDWRCPIEVECSEAGAVDLALYAWLTGLEPTRFELSTNPMMHQALIPYDVYEIRLLAIIPHPKTIAETIPMEDYLVTFAVSLKTE
jgi:hypothetical protein